MKNVLIVGTFDTKGHEFQFIKELIEKRCLSTTTVNCGVIGEPLFVPDVTSEAVAIAGGSTLAELQKQHDRGLGIDVMMAGAAKITIAEVEKLLPAGALDPNQIHIPGIMVQRIFKGEKFEKRIEQRTTSKRN